MMPTVRQRAAARQRAVVTLGLVALVLLALAYAYLTMSGDRDGTGTGGSATTGQPTIGPPRFAAIELAGAGDATPRFSIPNDVAAIAEITHDGRSTFSVRALAADDSEQLLISTTGEYRGTVLFDQAEGLHSVALQIEADGAWQATIRPVPDARRWDQSGYLTGTGDDVVLLEPATSGRTTITITHRGQSRFTVVSYASPGGGTLVNAMGSYAGVSVLDEGTFVLEITADGGWSISPPR
jgi:hypothetical protein